MNVHHLALSPGARQAGLSQGTPGVQQAQPHRSTRQAQHAKDDEPPIHIPSSILSHTSNNVSGEQGTDKPKPWFTLPRDLTPHNI